MAWGWRVHETRKSSSFIRRSGGDYAAMMMRPEIQFMRAAEADFGLYFETASLFCVMNRQRLVCWLVGWLVGWSVGRSVGRLVERVFETNAQFACGRVGTTGR